MKTRYYDRVVSYKNFKFKIIFPTLMKNDICDHKLNFCLIIMNQMDLFFEAIRLI